MAQLSPTIRLSSDTTVQNATLRDAFAHRSGFSAHDFLWYRAPWDLSETLRRASLLPARGRPGERYQYSSVAFAAAAEALCQRRNQPWREAIVTQLAGPLGIPNLLTTGEQFSTCADRPWGHQLDANHRIVDYPFWMPTGANPAGTLYASAEAMVPWLRFLLRGPQAGMNLPAPQQDCFRPQILQPWTDELRLQFPLTRAVHYGLGWVVFDYRGETIVAHGGIADGFRSQIVLLPRLRLGMAFFNNRHDHRMNQAIAQTILDTYLPGPAVDWHRYYLEREPAPQPRAVHPKNTEPTPDPDVAVGRYRHAAYGECDVQRLPEGLRWRWGSMSALLHPLGGSEYRLTGSYFEGRSLTIRENTLIPPQGMECIFQRVEIKEPVPPRE